MPTIFEQLQGLLIDKFSLEPEKITPEATIESLGLDSLDFIDLLFEVEEKFNIRVPQEGGTQALRATTLQGIVASIESLVAEAAPVQPAAGQQQ